jgi:pimeloyl-ACP methyl ester carboxylesterase
MKKPSHKTMTLIYLIIFFYIIAGIMLYKYQKQLIFRRDKLDKSYTFHFDEPFKEFNLPLNDTDRLNAVLLKADTAKGIVIYFHGNTGNISHYSKATSIFIRHHYDVLMMDYPGYGKSTGPNSEHDLYNDADLMYQLARNYYQPDSIIIYGRSLGTAMASELASRQYCKALVLECPFYSFDALASHYLPIYPVSWLLQYHFPVHKFVQHVLVPVIIFHGTKDGVIPHGQSRKLKASLKPEDRFITIPKGRHNDLYHQPLYKKVMDSLLQK